ncbi:MAG TPA: potassium/proton antiporter [Acidimicrobiales bacterium]|nr:potassium/proton antiporter [Acidimicrobiales bacterium]
MTGIELALVVGGGLLTLAVLASKAASRLGLPVVLLFMAIGMLAGSEGPGGIELDDAELVQRVGVVALAFILFSGGLDTRWSDVRPVLGPGLGLATVGVVVTAGVTGLAATVVLGVPLEVGLLVGAVMGSTDAAAVFSILRSRAVGLRGRIRPLLELESASNDPMAVFLTVAILERLGDPDRSLLAFGVIFAQQAVLGAVGGALAGVLVVTALNRLRLEVDGLHAALTVAGVLLTFGAVALVGGSGFLAVYVLGLVMARREFVHRRSLERFHDALSWIGQIAMFLALGLLVFPSELVEVAWSALGVAAVLVLVARPLAVIVTLTPARVPWRDQALVAWVGLRGAVPIILATFALVEGVDQADLVFDTVFFVVLVSFIVQGTTVRSVARLLGVAEDAPSPVPYPVEFVATIGGREGMTELRVDPACAAVGRQIVELGLPHEALVVLIRRPDGFVIPQGTTVIEGGDELLVLADRTSLAAIERLLGPPEAQTSGQG